MVTVVNNNENSSPQTGRSKKGSGDSTTKLMLSVPVNCLFFPKIMTIWICSNKIIRQVPSTINYETEFSDFFFFFLI